MVLLESHDQDNGRGLGSSVCCRLVAKLTTANTLYKNSMNSIVNQSAQTKSTGLHKQMPILIFALPLKQWSLDCLILSETEDAKRTSTEAEYVIYLG